MLFPNFFATGLTPWGFPLSFRYHCTAGVVDATQETKWPQGCNESSEANSKAKGESLKLLRLVFDKLLAIAL